MLSSLFAAVEERWLVPAYSSHRAGAWIAAHACLTLPLRAQGVVRLYEVSEPHSGPATGLRTVLTAGAPHRLRRFVERLAGALQERESGPARAVWSPAALAAARADLVVVEVHRWAAAKFRREGWYIIPDAVRWRGEVARMPPVPPSKSLRDDLRKIRRYGYELESAASDADWDQFYTTMVVPYAEARFGDSAWIPSVRLLRTFRKVGTLQFVCRGGVRVGGFCMIPAGESVWIPVLGTLVGDEALRREGALAAVYALGIQWAKAHGYRVVDKGRTSAFLHDGIAVFKRKWGLEPVPDPLSHLFAVRIASDLAEAVFARAPVLMETGSGLAPLTGAAP